MTGVLAAGEGGRQTQEREASMLNCCRCSSLLSLPSVYTLCVPPTCKIGLAFAFLDLPTILEAAHCRARRAGPDRRTVGRSTA